MHLRSTLFTIQETRSLSLSQRLDQYSPWLLKMLANFRIWTKPPRVKAAQFYSAEMWLQPPPQILIFYLRLGNLSQPRPLLSLHQIGWAHSRTFLTSPQKEWRFHFFISMRGLSSEESTEQMNKSEMTKMRTTKIFFVKVELIRIQRFSSNQVTTQTEAAPWTC